MKKTFRQCAIDYIQNRHLCKGYVDYIVVQLEKLEKIEQIVDNCDSGMIGTVQLFLRIREVLNG